MTVQPLLKKWKYSIPSPDFWSNSPRVRTMKLEMAQQESWYWLAHSSNKHKNCWIRVFRTYNVGLHPLKISDGFDLAVDVAVKRLEELSEEIAFSKTDYKELVDAACVSLGSKVVSKDQKRLAEIAVKAVLTVADLERKDVNLDLIKIQ